MADETITFLLLISFFFLVYHEILFCWQSDVMDSLCSCAVHAAPYVDDEIFRSHLIFRLFFCVSQSEDIIKQCDESYQK